MRFLKYSLRLYFLPKSISVAPEIIKNTGTAK